MSRQAHLPPLYPFQKRVSSSLVRDSLAQTLHRNEDLGPRHHRSPSDSCIIDEQPSWLDDLLSDPDMNLNRASHHRSTSDSGTLFNAPAPFPSLNLLADDESLVPNEAGRGLDATCAYSPNSPRQMVNSDNFDRLMVSALSKYVPQHSIQFVNGNLFTSQNISSDLKVDGSGVVIELNSEVKLAKRHSGQRSRVRKLQYIAELERKVNGLEILESELAARVSSLLQQRVILSMENKNLKQQIWSFQQEKLIMDVQYRSLKKEVERLKKGFENHFKSESSMHVRAGSVGEAVASVMDWKMIDMQKLTLG